MQRLQFPLTLGSFKKSLDVGSEYVEKLLASRMLHGKNDKAREIGDVLTTGYADHGRCITISETKELGLNVLEIEDDSLDILWNIHKLNKERESLIQQEQEEEIRKQLKDISPELLDNLEMKPKG